MPIVHRVFTPTCMRPRGDALTDRYMVDIDTPTPFVRRFGPYVTRADAMRAMRRLLTECAAQTGGGRAWVKRLTVSGFGVTVWYGEYVAHMPPTATR